MLLGMWSRKIHHSAMPRQASIRGSRTWPFSSGSSPTTNVGMVIRSCICITPSRHNGHAAGRTGVSWFTFKGLFLQANLRASVELCQLRTRAVELREYGLALDEVAWI